MNERDKHAADDTYGYIKYSNAREIARSAINIALRKVSDSTSTVFDSGQLDGGTYSVSLSRVDSFMDVTSIARFSDTTYRILSHLLVYPKPFPEVGAAVGLNVDSVGMTMKGTPFIDGHNYDINGQNPSDSGAVPGVAVLTSKPDSVTVAKYGAYIDGSTDVAINSNMADPEAFVDLYMSTAKYVLTPAGSPYSGNQTYGDMANPQIVFIDGSDSTKAVKVSGTIQGWGILVVRGYFQLTGTIDWHGLVVVASDAVFDFSLAKGTPRIIGSLLMGGPPHSTLEMRGTAQILYSSTTIDKAKYIGKLLAYHILDWYE